MEVRLVGMKFLEKLGIEDVRSLKGFHNKVYEGLHKGAKIIVRDSVRRTEEALKEEMRVLDCIRSHVPIGEPYPIGGVSVVSYRGHVYAFFKKVDALAWHETTLTDTVHYNAGRALATLHASMRKIKGVRRAAYEKHPDLQLLQSTDAITNTELRRTLSELDTFGKDEKEYGLIHGDYLFSNLLYRDSDVTIIDFDDMEYGYYLYDIAVYLFYLFLGGAPSQIDIHANREVFKHFIQGYQSVNETIRLDFNKIQPLFRLRQLKLLATIKHTIGPSDYGPWQEAYIDLCEKQFEKHKPFLDVDFQAMHDMIKIRG